MKPFEYWRDHSNRNLCEYLCSGTVFVLLDTETTGLKPSEDRITEFSAATLVFKRGTFYNVRPPMDIFIKPDIPVSPGAAEVSGITNDFLADKPTESEIFPTIYALLGDHPVLCGHNTWFDMQMIQAMYERHGKTFAPSIVGDTLEMARDLVPPWETENYRLSTLVGLYGLDKGIQFHRSIDDVRATALLLRTFYQEYRTTEEHNGDTDLTPQQIWFFEGYNHKQKSIYVQTKYGKFYFNLYYKVWMSKLDEFQDTFDMESFQERVLRRMHLSNAKELGKISSQSRFQSCF